MLGITDGTNWEFWTFIAGSITAFAVVASAVTAWVVFAQQSDQSGRRKPVRASRARLEYHMVMGYGVPELPSVICELPNLYRTFYIHLYNDTDHEQILRVIGGRVRWPMFKSGQPVALSQTVFLSPKGGGVIGIVFCGNDWPVRTTSSPEYAHEGTWRISFKATNARRGVIKYHGKAQMTDITDQQRTELGCNGDDDPTP